MDNVVFEDPSKPRIHAKRRVHVEPASCCVSYLREYMNEVEETAIAPNSDMPLQDHSHTIFVGHSGKSEWPRATPGMPT
ncbi:hypothetical protein LTR93_012051, partial [Exophiala xenobiotica]